MSTSVVSVRLSGELKNRLDALSAATGRPASFYVREAVAERLDALEWQYGIAQQAADLRTGRTQSVGMSEVMAELGITAADLDATEVELDATQVTSPTQT